MTERTEILDTLDLELLRTLEAVWLERNVARSALRLGVSQPLVSQRLTRLRLLLQDQLFVRAPGGVAPTELTQVIAPTIHRALTELRETLQRTQLFNPNTAERQFVLHLSDSAELAFLPGLHRHLREHAPGIRLKCVRLSAEALPSALEHQSVHLAIGVFPQLGSEYQRAHLLTQDHLLVMGCSHPFSNREVTLADLPELDFLMVGDFSDVETLMAELGLTGRIRQRVGHYLAVPMLLSGGTLAAWLPRSLVQPLSLFGDYRAFSLPQAQQVFSVHAIRLRRSERDPGLNWLWDTLVTTIRADILSRGTDLGHTGD